MQAKRQARVRIFFIALLPGVLAGCAPYGRVNSEPNPLISRETVERARHWQRQQSINDDAVRRPVRREQAKTATRPPVEEIREKQKPAAQPPADKGNEARQAVPPANAAASPVKEAAPLAKTDVPVKNPAPVPKAAEAPKGAAPAKTPTQGAEERISVDAALAKADEALKREEQFPRLLPRVRK